MDKAMDKLGFDTQLLLSSPVFKTPWHHYVIHYVLLTLIVWGPPNKTLRRALVVPMLLHLFRSPPCWRPTGPNTQPICGLLHGVVMGKLFNTTLVLLAGTPMEYTDYRLDRGMDLDRLSVFTWRKFRWAWERCFVNMRGIGWNWEYKYVPKRPCVNKWWFILIKCQFFETFVKYIGYDMCVTLHWYLNLENGVLHAWPLTRLMVDNLLFTYIIYFSLNVSYYQLASMSLALGVSDVSQWPEMFQLFHSDYSLKAFWTVWWHQFLSLDSIKLTGWLVGDRRILSVLVVFTINGLIHVYGSLCANPAILPWKSLFFFAFSGVNLLVERKLWKWRFFPILAQILLTTLYQSELEDCGIEFPLFNRYLSMSYLLKAKQ